MYCNTVCPVGTILGCLSRISLFRVRIDEEDCITCRICEKQCRAECIDIENMTIDHSRCVLCFDCVSVCPESAMSYRTGSTVRGDQAPADHSRRQFFIHAGVAVGAFIGADHYTHRRSRGRVPLLIGPLNCLFLEITIHLLRHFM